MFTGTNKPLWTTMASLLTVSTAFQLLTFIAFNDDGCKDDAVNETFTNCAVEEGAAFAISASLFYLLSSIGMFLVSHPQVPLVSLQEGWRGADIAKVSVFLPFEARKQRIQMYQIQQKNNTMRL